MFGYQLQSKVPRVVAAGALAVVVGACAAGATPTPVPPAPATAAPATAAPSAATGALTIATSSANGLGPFLTGNGGKTTYVFLKDTQPNTSACSGNCAGNWPAVTVPSGASAPAAGSGITGQFSTFQRSDGTTQVAFNGHPLYYFAGDKAAGDTNGEGVLGIWFVANADGSVPTAAPQSPKASPAPSAAPSAAAGGTTIASAAAALGTVLTGKNGLTLYVYDNDTTPNKSACSGDCATNWPPLTVAAGSAPTAASGISGKLGTFKRDDGTTQVTYAGWPLYTFVEDKKPGEDNGTDSKAFGASWYPLHPNGEKAGH